MANVYDAAYNLVNTLKESNEYKEYKKAKEKIDNDPKLKEMIKDFKKKQFEIQTMQLQGKQVASDDIYKLQQLYQIISLHNDINEFLSKEIILQKILADITKIIAEAIDFDNEFLKDLEENS
ncbi:YlbF family regulator [Caldicellulosiruptoraceae bacterium PP1]